MSVRSWWNRLTFEVQCWRLHAPRGVKTHNDHHAVTLHGSASLWAVYRGPWVEHRPPLRIVGFMVQTQGEAYLHRLTLQGLVRCKKVIFPAEFTTYLPGFDLDLTQGDLVNLTIEVALGEPGPFPSILVVVQTMEPVWSTGKDVLRAFFGLPDLPVS